MTEPEKAASPEPQPQAAAVPAPAQPEALPGSVASGSGPPVEALRPDEEALDDEQVMKLVGEHKLRLERMPDDARPPAPGTSRPSWRRRTYVVDWKLQLSYAGLYIATITLFVVGFAAANLIYLRLIQWARINQHLVAQDWWQKDDAGVYIVLNFVVLLFIGMGMALWAIVQSHRVAGPALRFRRAFRQMRRRDYDFYLRLRKNDFLKELAVELNVLNNALKAKDLVLSDAVLRLDALARTANDPERATEIHEVAQDLADLVLPLPEPQVDATPETVKKV
ncbi:MAG TPA: hypothetical protein VFF73_20600 [Planctomycetota bacterium]|nr:hypothetical protein [Planctomycetota bacterium]